jgi:hypothetical protein
MPDQVRHDAVFVGCGNAELEIQHSRGRATWFILSFPAFLSLLRFSPPLSVLPESDCGHGQQGEDGHEQDQPGAVGGSRHMGNILLDVKSTGDTEY